MSAVSGVVWERANKQPTVLLGSESVTNTTIHPSLSFVTAKRMEQSDVKSARTMPVRNGLMPWAGTRERSPSKKVHLLLVDSGAS